VGSPGEIRHMAISATVSGGAQHGASILTHAQHVVAQNALDRLNALKPTSATVFGGVKSSGLGGPNLVHGQGNDTFLSGARAVSTHALANIGNDTVVSGSAANPGHMKPEGHLGHSVPNFSLSSDTISVKGTTAEDIKGAHQEGTTTTSHTIALSDKTKVTISGLTHHDVSKLPH
jgi:hypothetical protein